MEDIWGECPYDKRGWKMKLINKKTGEIIDGGDYLNVYDDLDHQGKSWHYNSLAELNKDWEDYTPKEPLIKDAGARDVMRLWAKVNHIPINATTIEYHFVESLCGTESEFWDNNLHIMFYGKIAPNAIHGKIYTIDELCGEEEE